MRQRLLEARRKESGFTLIELLIVIVILGVLAAVVVFAVGAFNDRGQTAACKSDAKAVEVAVEAYRANEGKYPDNLGQLDDAPGNYLRSIPNEDSTKGEYYITYNSETGEVTGNLAGGADCMNPEPAST